MFLSGNLKGVMIPPSLYTEFGWAYVERTEFLRENPSGALIDTPPSAQIWIDLNAELSRNVDSGVIEYYEITRLSQESDRIAQSSGIKVEPPDALHFIESFRRQAFLLGKTASEHANTIEGEFPALQAQDKLRLARALHTAVMQSRLQT